MRPSDRLFSSYAIDGIRMVGLLRTENTITVVLLSFAVRGLMKRFSDRGAFLWGGLVYVLGYSFLVYGLAPWLLVAAMLAATAGELLYVPVKQAYLGTIAPEHSRSSYMAVTSMTHRGSMLIAAGAVVLGGFLPSPAMAAIIAVTGLAGLMTIRLLMPRLDARQAKADSMQGRTMSA